MQTAQNSLVGKNALWAAYQNSGPLKHHEILLEIKAAGLYRHWQTVASKHGYDLTMAKAPLRDIFLKILPETAELFGLPPVNTKTSPKKQKPTIPSAPTLFE